MEIILFVIFILLLIFGLTDRFITNRKYFAPILYWGAALILILLSGFREIGFDPDSIGYENYYNSQNIYILAEPTYAFISNLVKFIFNDFRWVLVFYAILAISIKFLAFRKLTKLYYLTILVYFGNYFILHDFTQIRAGVASGLLLIAIIPLAERKYWQYLFIAILAFLFHYSAIVMLLLLLLDNKIFSKTTKVILYLSIPLGILCYMLKLDLIFIIPIETVKMKIEIYKSMQETADVGLNVFNMLYLVKYLVFYILLFFYDLLYEKTKYVSVLLKIYGISLIAFLTLSQNTVIAMRISELFGVVEVILVPYLFYIIKEKVVGAALVSIFAFIYLYINIYIQVIHQVH